MNATEYAKAYVPPPDTPVGRAIAEAGGKVAWDRMENSARQAFLLKSKERHGRARQAAWLKEALAVEKASRDAQVEANRVRNVRAAAAGAMAAREKMTSEEKTAAALAEREAYAALDREILARKQAAAKAAAVNSKVKTRAAFHQLTPAARMAFMKTGGKLSD